MLQRLRENLFDIRPEEWGKALSLSVYFFLVIAVFWVLKPMKRGVVINYFGDRPLEVLGLVFSGAQAEQVGKVLNMVIAFLVVAAFTWLVRRLARHWVILLFTALFAGFFVFFGTVIDDLERLGSPAVWTFYVMGDIWTTVMVATFWAFANDLNTAEEAERLYGVVGLGGVLGGFVGASVVAGLVTQVGRAPLLFALVVPAAAIAGLVYWLHHREITHHGHGEPCCPEGEDPEPAPIADNAFIEGGRIVVQSRYLLGIAALLGIYEVVSNVVDFQLAAVVEQEIAAATAKDRFFGFVGQATSLVSIGVQLLLTSFVMKKYGVKIALLFLPLAVLGGSVGFLVVPTVLLAGFMSVSDNALNYSINQSAREALYTPTSQDAKYKAKAFIDMFIQRAAKVLAVVLNLGLTAVAFVGVRWLSIPVVFLIAVWILIIHFLGDEFEARRSDTGEEVRVPG